MQRGETSLDFRGGGSADMSIYSSQFRSLGLRLHYEIGCACASPTFIRHGDFDGLARSRGLPHMQFMGSWVAGSPRGHQVRRHVDSSGIDIMEGRQGGVPLQVVCGN